MHGPRLFRITLLALVLVVCFAGIAHVLLPSLFPRRPFALVGPRAEFADDACAEFAPTGKDRHITVFLDPGHGGPDPGASTIAPNGKSLEEKSLTLPVALDTLAILRSDGFHVVMSRIHDTPVRRLESGSLAGGAYTVAGEHADIEARVDCANAAHAQLLLSIHFDAYSDPSVGGVETAYDPARAFSAQNLRFAGLVQAAVLHQFQSENWTIPDRLVVPDSDLGTPTISSQAASYGHLLELGPADPGWFDHPSEMPGALCEPLFITDAHEAAIAQSSAGQQALARAFAQAINEYFPS